MKKSNLGIILAVATLLFGGCSDFYQTDNNVENVEVDLVNEETDILDWNYIKSTLIAKGNSLGMILDTSLTRDNQGYESPWQSSYMPVTNENVIGYIGSQMESVAKWGWEYFNLFNTIKVSLTSFFFFFYFALSLLKYLILLILYLS